MPELPEEVLQQIFANLQGSPPDVFVNERLHRQTLAAVCLASRQCCRLAQPVLFHTVRLGDSQIPTQSFWEVLVLQPRLTRHVRSLHIEGWEHPRLEPDFTPEQIALELDRLGYQVSQPVRDAAEDALVPLRSILGPTYETVRSRLLAGIADGMLVYLIARCENLICLGLSVPHRFPDYTCVYSALRHMAQRPLASDTPSDGSHCHQLLRPLSKLKELWMYHWDTENSFNGSEAMQFWSLDSLNVFRGSLIDCNSQEGFRDAPAVKQNNIRELVLDNALVDADGLRDIMSRCPKLEVLSISWGAALVGDCIVNHQQLGQVLRDFLHISKNLKTLIFDPIDAYDYENSDEEFHEPLGSLKFLQSLEHLALTLKGLIGEDDEDGDEYPNFASLPLTEMLPESLQTLDVRDLQSPYGSEVYNNMMRRRVPFDRQLYSLMSDTRFRKLRTIKLNRQINEGETSPKDLGWEQVKFENTWIRRHDYALTP